MDILFYSAKTPSVQALFGGKCQQGPNSTGMMLSRGNAFWVVAKNRDSRDNKQHLLPRKFLLQISTHELNASGKSELKVWRIIEHPELEAIVTASLWRTFKQKHISVLAKWICYTFWREVSRILDLLGHLRQRFQKFDSIGTLATNVSEFWTHWDHCNRVF